MKQVNNPPQNDWERICSRSTLGQANLDEICQEIFEVVENGGDKKLIEYTQRFDNVLLERICLTKDEVQLLAERTPLDLRQAIDIAYKNIRKFHKAQELDVAAETVETSPGIICWRESRAIEKVGLYIPGGTAPLISTVLMLGIPAQIAGCKEIVLCTPPRPDGSVEPSICYAALKVGVTKLVCVGGAQAIAALSIGTDSVPRVDKIFGPGNQYVTAAKQYAVKYGVAIDMPAGPSEVMVIADKSANPAYVAADLLSQAEHGIDSQVVLAALNRQIVREVLVEIKEQLRGLPRKAIAEEVLKNSYAITFSKREQAMAFANFYAPEHIILSVSSPTKMARQIVNAGSVFLGNYSPESAGDYASGTNHTLPTSGWAKSYGGVSLDSFVKKITFQQVSKRGLTQLGPTITALAEAEGLKAHALAVSIRTQAK